MNSISRGGWFSFILANGWTEYDDADDSTYAFWNEAEEPWTGNFRITAFQWPNVTDSNVDKASEYITTEVLENTGAQKIILGEYDCAHYKKEFEQEEITKLFIIGSRENKMIYLSAHSQLIKNRKQMPMNARELMAVENMIRSIKII